MVRKCAISSSKKLEQNAVLWSGLIGQWELSTFEASYIERQQGLTCCQCGNNLRVMALANAITSAYGFVGIFSEFVRQEEYCRLRILEISKIGCLRPFLNGFRGYQSVEYPEYDLCNLTQITDGTVDVVIHSDVLEHIPDPVKGLQECRRVLIPGGHCVFTVPLIVGRMSRQRTGLPPSFHGPANTNLDDYIVHTEFGADVWTHVVNAGFHSVALKCIEYPAAIAVVATVGGGCDCGC